MHQMLALAVLLVIISSTIAHADADIRTVDFQNFTYHPTLCAREFGKDGIGKTVLVRNGEWKGKNADYNVYNTVTYGDLVGDGREEAIVQTGCAPKGANYSLSEVFIFGIRGDQPSLITALDQSEIQKYYEKFNHNGILWNIGVTEYRIDNKTIVFVAPADGAHCCPECEVMFEYRLQNGKLVPTQKPVKKLFTQ